MAFKALYIECFLVCILSHQDPKILPESEYEGHFSDEGSKKVCLKGRDEGDQASDIHECVDGYPFH